MKDIGAPSATGMVRVGASSCGDTESIKQSGPSRRSVLLGASALVAASLHIARAQGGAEEWQLFNLREDPGETRDLARENPAKVTELVALWEDYVRANGVILSGDGPFTARDK